MHKSETILIRRERGRRSLRCNELAERAAAATAGVARLR